MNNDTANSLLAGLTALASRLPGGRRASTPRTVLVVRWGNIGDIVVTLPAFHALRRLYPDARLILLTTPTTRGTPGARELLAHDGTFDEMIVYYADESQHPSFLRNLRRKLKGLDIDLAVLFANQRAHFGNVAKYLALLSSVGVRRFAGFSVFSEDDYRVRQIERSMAVVRELGEARIEPAPWLSITETARASVADMVPSSKDGPLVVMHGGSKPMVNRWKAGNFVEVGRRLVQQYGAHIVLTGSAGEADLVAAIAAGIGERASSLAGRTDVQQLVAVVERADLVVSNNTGTMHLAYALGRPLVCVSGARDRRMVWEPYGTSYVMLREEVECAGCDVDVCPRYEYAKCLDVIDVDRVWDAVVALLATQERKANS